MKHAYKLLILLLLCSVPSFAQNMGIGGSTNPQYPLDVNGRIRIRFRTNEGAGLWFNKPDNTLGSFIGQTSTGHFGIANNATGNWGFVFDHTNTRFGIGTDAPTSPLTVKYFGNGIEHSNPGGTVRMSTYVGNSSGILQTLTNHPLRFATNDAFQAQMTLGTNGYLGIGTLTPSHPLSFPSVVGNKVSLWSTDPTSSTAAHYGLGIQGYQFQLFAPTVTDNIVFGIGSSDNFTENMRVSGDGNVGIGTNAPVKAGLTVDKKVFSTNAIFGSTTSGVSIESNFPTVVFNGYSVANLSRRPLVNGYMASIGFNYATGDFAIYSSTSSGTTGSNLSTTNRFTIKANGNVGIGDNDPDSPLTLRPGTDGIGLDHTSSEGSIRMGTYVSALGAYLRTHSNTSLNFATNSSISPGMVLRTDGQVLIGTTLPGQGGLVVNKKVGAVNAVFGSTTTGIAVETDWPGVAFNSYYNNGRKAIAPGFGALIGQDPNSGRVYIQNSPTSVGAANGPMATLERISILANGNVGIGTTNPTQALAVNGTIRAKEVIVETGWADFVFEPGYRLRPLAEVEQFIQEHRHLPDLMPATDIQQKGAGLADVTTKMMQKIEELTLYVIEQQKQIQQLRQQLQQTQAQPATPTR